MLRLLQYLPASNKAGVTVREILDSAFRQNFDEPGKANPHKAEAIKHLKEAIDQGKQGNADEATTHAEIALNHLQQVN